jgi:RimJ/RimL family protein N-acetyltransferase
MCAVAHAGTVVVPVTTELAGYLLDDPDQLVARHGLTLVEGYLAFPEALAPMLAALEEGGAPEWFSHLIVDPAAREVVGLGGFKGPPRGGEVEVGYSVAPSRRGRGHATAAVLAFLERAGARGVDTVCAHTLPEENPSTSVLRRCGFVRTGDDLDPGVGPVWRWGRRIVDV